MAHIDDCLCDIKIVLAREDVAKSWPLQNTVKGPI